MTPDATSPDPIESAAFGQSQRSSLRSRVVLLVAAVGLAGLTGTCAVLSLLGFIREPNIPELFPVVLCGVVCGVSLFASYGLLREMLRRPTD